MMKSKALAAGILLAMAAPSVMAESFYGAFDIGQSDFRKGCNGVAAGVSCKHTDTAFRLAAGYQVNQNFGVEGAYVESGKSTASAPGIFTAEVKSTEWQLVATGTLPMGNGFSLIGKAGFAFWEAKPSATALGAAVPIASETGDDFLWGIGAQYDFTKSVAVRGQYESHKIGNTTLDRGDLDTFSMGVVYKF